MATKAQKLANRKNAAKSTGPITDAGKIAASRNALKHGMASETKIIAGENIEMFKAMEDALIEEHQPATPTEMILVRDMAKHTWLAQRAVFFQNLAIERSFFKTGALPQGFSVLLRYQTTNERGFQKALATLRSLRKETPKSEIGSVSQTLVKAAQSAAPNPVPIDFNTAVQPLAGDSSLPEVGGAALTEAA